MIRNLVLTPGLKRATKSHLIGRAEARPSKRQNFLMEEGGAFFRHASTENIPRYFKSLR